MILWRSGQACSGLGGPIRAPGVLWRGVGGTHLVPSRLRSARAALGGALFEKSGRFHGADFFGNGHYKKGVHGGVVRSGNALGGLFQGLGQVQNNAGCMSRWHRPAH